MKPDRVRMIVFILLVAAIGVAIAYAYRGQFNATILEQWVQDAGNTGPLVFMFLYALFTVLFLPGSVLTLAGGALFGPVLGTLYNLGGATIGATLAFLISRNLASEWVEHKTGGRLKALKDGIESEGWRFVAFVRLVPLFPFNLLNYALGLTRISLLHYILTSLICMAPGAIAYTYLGYAGREALTGSEGLIQTGLIALALLASVAFLPRLIRKLRQGPALNVTALKNKIARGEDVTVLDVRTASDFHDNLGHIAQARNIPVEELEQHLNELSDLKARKIALICRTDKRSIKAATLMAQKGFSDVHVVNGGMMEWNRMGYHIER